MHLTVFGAGGVGGYIAAKMGAVLGTTGCPFRELSVVARGAHLETIQREGLTYIDPYGTTSTVYPNVASHEIKRFPTPQFVILAVKGYDLEAAADHLAERIDANTPILPLLNGADIDERVRARLGGRGIVLPGAIYIGAFVEQPGRVRHAGGPGSVLLGRSPDNPEYRPQEFLTACETAGIPVQWYDDPAPAIWEKFLFIAPFSLVTAISGKTIGEVLNDDGLTADVRAIMSEAATIAVTKGVALPENIVDLVMEKAAGFPAGMTTSFQRDIAADSPRDERDIFSGSILRHGKSLGVPTPVTARYTAALPEPAAQVRAEGGGKSAE